MKDAIKEKKKNEFLTLMQILLTCGRCVVSAIGHVVAQLPIHKVTIGRSKLSLLESEDFLKRLRPKTYSIP